MSAGVSQFTPVPQALNPVGSDRNPKAYSAAISSALTDASYQDHHTGAASAFSHMSKL